MKLTQRELRDISTAASAKGLIAITEERMRELHAMTPEEFDAAMKDIKADPIRKTHRMLWPRVA